MKTVTKIQISREEALMALTALVRQTDPTLATAEVKDYESKMLPGGIPGMELTLAGVTGESGKQHLNRAPAASL